MSLLERIQNIHNSNKFTINSKYYIDDEYSYERRKIIFLLADILEKNNNFKILNKNIQDDIIYGIEKSCYDKTIKKSNTETVFISWDNERFVYLYQLIVTKITKNLDIESEVNDNYLINKIINGDIDIKCIADLTSEMLCPNSCLDIKTNLNLRRNQKLNYKTSSLYTCKNCKNKRTMIKSIQTRSLDEGNSLSITCIECQYNWVIS